MQGCLEDCNFVAALALLANSASSGSLFKRLLPTCDLEAGRCCTRFFLEGAWRDVEVDTFLPCINGSPAFARSRDGSEVYMCLLEKAYAKAHGSYAAICGGRALETLQDLTGAPAEEVRITDDDLLGLWKQVLHHHGEQDLLACSRADFGNKVCDIPGGDGLVANHTYAILDCVEARRCGMPHRLLKVFNPWGRCGWVGAWSAGSKEWSSELLEDLGVGGGGDSGVFWIELGDFARQISWMLASTSRSHRGVRADASTSTPSARTRCSASSLLPDRSR
mmetsp:Transcript_123899/g.396009  ORF Transcript_123899/g.396009 Transcript_123899/m.396009 type:complete len:278 (-) Transcript_123899:639-1472(-)